MADVMKQALEALESCREGDYSTGFVIHPSFDEKAVNAAIAALEAAIAQQGEPAFWVLRHQLEARETTCNGRMWFTDPVNSGWVPVYTAPVAQQGETPKCSPTLTECPRCGNDIQKCDAVHAPQPVAQPPIPLQFEDENPELTAYQRGFNDRVACTEKAHLLEDFQRECDAADELMRLLGLEPHQCRTEGGAINIGRVRSLLGDAERPVTLADALTRLLERSSSEHWPVEQQLAMDALNRYSAQPVAQPAPARLTDEQVLRCLATMTHEVPARLPPGWRKFARAVESACASAWGVKLGGGV